MMRMWMILSLLVLAPGRAAAASQGAEEVSLYERGWDWTDIGQARAIAKRAKQDTQRIVELRDAGLAWSQISEGHGFKLAEVAKEAAEQSQQAQKRSAAKVKRRPVATLISAPLPSGSTTQ